MRRRPTRAELAARRERLRARVRERARAARERRGRQRRRRWPWVLAILLLLLLLLRDCSCAGPVPVPDAPAQGEATGGAPAPEPAPMGRIAPIARPEFAPPAPEVVPWLTAFRLQVAARSPRLAACFVGVDRPGTLKWTASVEPASGRVSDATIEPTLDGVALTAEQRACVLGALAEPPYRLEGGDKATPSRVGIAIEF